MTVKPHHAVPYRKRHIGLVLLCLTGIITLAILMVQYRDQVIAGVASSKNFVSDMFTATKHTPTTIVSTNGFSLSVDQQKLYVVGIDNTGTLYQGDTLSQKHAYAKIQIATASTTRLVDNKSALTIAYHGSSKAMTGSDMSTLAFTSAGIDRQKLDFIRTEQTIIDGQTFERSIWKTKEANGPVKNLRASFSTYVARINGHPLTVVVSEGITSEPGQHPQFDTIIQSLHFSTPVASQPTEKPTSSAGVSSPSLLDTLLMSHVAAAASKQTESVNDSEKVAAMYSPAVVKVYNLFCMDIAVDGSTFLKNVCDVGSGSGFFVSQDGYLATNGHVVASDPKDQAIFYAFAAAGAGNLDYLTYLLQVSGAKQSDFTGITDEKELSQKFVDILYKIDDAKFQKRNDVTSVFAVLGSKQPDGDELVKAVTARQKPTLDDTWKSANLIASDFRTIDGTFTGAFKASDVAILKLDGTNFPVTHLGSFDDITQGGDLSILGFPGNANSNGIVESKTTTATLTTGKVSAKKNANGSDKRLIETDTTIGHGNSGGPAFSDDGNVVGIATYTSDGSGVGTATYNYIRDIKDLQDLAAKQSITFDTNSKTQQEWETGLGYFYTSHYSTALKNFEKVKELYPNHNKVAEFIATAQKRIANGEDVVDFPVIPVAIAGVVFIAGLGIGIFLIVRHKKHHSVYKAGITQGSIDPTTHGGKPQIVAVTAGPTVQPVAPQVPVSTSPTVSALGAAAVTDIVQSQAVTIESVESESTAPQDELVAPQSVIMQEPDELPEAPAAFVQPVIAAQPRTPAPFSVPTREGDSRPATRSL